MLSTGTRGSRRGARGGGEWPSATTRYEALERIGEGTLFVVYRVRDRSTNRDVALKALRSVFTRHPGFGAALTAAARRTVEWNHPCLAEVYEVGEEDGTIFIVGESLPGPSLEMRLKRGPLSIATASTYFQDILSALAYLHQHGAAHGDLRPRQIIQGADGRMKLNDGGLTAAFAATGIAPTDVLHDHAFYQAPEATNGTPAPAADLYSAGAVLYQMLTGRVPFDGTSPLVIARRHRHDAPLPPGSYNPDCPVFLEAICLNLLEKDPALRYGSAREALRDLEAGRSPQRGSEPAAMAAPVAVSEPLPVEAVDEVTTPAAELRPTIQPAPRRELTRPVIAPLDHEEVEVDPNATLRQERKQQRRNDARGALLAFIWSLITAGVLVGIIGGAWYFWIQDTPREVVVPQYIGVEQGVAAQTMQALGIKLEVRRETYDAKKPAGTILSGNVPAGRHVRTGKEIHVTVSQGPAPIQMPLFVELTLQAARQIIVQHGMRLGQVSEQYHETIPAGYICDQYPRANQPFRRSDPINLIVSKGPLPSRTNAGGFSAPLADSNGTVSDSNIESPPPGVGDSMPSTDDSQTGDLEQPTSSPNVQLVLRAVRVRVAIPTDTAAQEVRIVVTDAKGERNVYRANRQPGDMIDQTVRVYRPQGGSATIRVYVGDNMVREQHV